MAAVIWTIHARCDLRRLHDYICAQGSPGTAGRFTDALTASVGRLTRNPARGTRVTESDNPNDRHLRFRAYRIIYRLEEDTVSILRVWHHARHLTTDDLT